MSDEANLFIDTWLAWMHSEDQKALARHIISAAVDDETKDKASIRRFLADLKEALES